MPEGKYKLSLQGFYRTGDNGVAYDIYQSGNEKINAYIYAGLSEKPLKSIYSYSFDEYVDDCWSPDWESHFYPNGMSSAAEAFSRGAYNNTVIFDHEIYENSDNIMVIGVMLDGGNYSNWCCLDNFKLEFCGDMVKAASIDVKAEKEKIIVSEKI